MAVILANPEVQRERKSRNERKTAPEQKYRKTPGMRREMLNRKEKTTQKGFKMKNST